MENRIKIDIAGNEITLVSDQSPEVMRKTASAVQERLYQIMRGNKTTTVIAAVLTAMNIMEELEKEKEACDQLRRELTRYAQENAEYKRQTEALNEKTETLKTELENLKVDYQMRDTAIRTMGEKDEELSHALRELESVREGHHRFRQESLSRQESLKREIEHLKNLLQAKEKEPAFPVDAEQMAAMKQQLQQWQQKWESACRELEAYRQREAAAGALGEELNAMRKTAEDNRLKYEEARGELENLRQQNEVREEAYQREREELQSELARYQESEEYEASDEEYAQEEDATVAELLEYKAKYEAVAEELESFKINYAMKSNELERLKKQFRR